MAEPSGMFKAGKILLLVGAILHAVFAVLLIVMSVLMLSLSGALGDDTAFPMVVAVVYLVGGILLAVGSVFGFVAYRRAKSGHAHSAWVNGLVASLLPPLQVVTLLGAIFCLVSPEGEAAQQARRSSQPL